MNIAFYSNPESGLYSAQVSWPHPMIVKAYSLAEIFKVTWDRLAAANALGRFASNIVVDFTLRDLREDKDRLEAQISTFSLALSRISDVDHPLGSPSSVKEARELAHLTFVRARQIERERRAAWRAGALAQTDASVDRDLLHALCGAVNDVLALLPPDATQQLADEETLRVALNRLRAVLAAGSAGG